MRYLMTVLLITGFVSAQMRAEEGKILKAGKVKKPIRVTVHPKDIVSLELADQDTQWMQEIHLSTGAKLYFNGTLHAFLFYFHPEKYTKGTIGREKITDFLVRDYVTGEKMPADSAFYLVDSKLKSPAGIDLVPVRGEEAKKLKKEYGGKIISFS